MSFLESFLHSTKALPEDVVRTLTLIRELDQAADQLQARIQLETAAIAEADVIAVKEEKADNGVTSEGQALVLERIAILHRDVIALHDEKLRLSESLYDLVDVCVRRLDADISHFAAFLRDSGTERTVVAVPAPTAGGGIGNLATAAVAAAAATAEQRAIGAAGDAGAVDEMVYCVCQRVAYGPMVQCDDDSCAISWFHYECVGLAAEPKGLWYCSGCKKP